MPAVKLNRVKAVEKEKDSLEGAKQEAEALLKKDVEIRRKNNILFQIHNMKATTELERLEEKKAAAPAADAEGTPLPAPMPGMIVKYEKKVGDTVNEGETVVILEAMKMENALAAPASGTIKAVNYGSGDSVAKGDVLCVIG